MKRRNLLAGIPLVATGLSGCLSGRTNEQKNSEDINEENNYQVCNEKTISIGRLPSAAKDEIRAAIEDGEYKTDGELILTKVVNIGQSYLEDDVDGEIIYYEAAVETGDSSTRLFVEKTWPKQQGGPITFENTTEKDLTVDSRIEYEGELFFEESIDIRAGEEIEVKGENEYRYGEYHAEISVPNEEKILDDEDTWRVDDFYGNPTIKIRIDEGEGNDTDSIYFDYPTDDAYPSGPCSWNDNGELK